MLIERLVGLVGAEPLLRTLRPGPSEFRAIFVSLLRRAVLVHALPNAVEVDDVTHHNSPVFKTRYAVAAMLATSVVRMSCRFFCRPVMIPVLVTEPAGDLGRDRFDSEPMRRERISSDAPIQRGPQQKSRTNCVAGHAENA